MRDKPTGGRCISDFRGQLFSFPTNASSPKTEVQLSARGLPEAYLLLTPQVHPHRCLVSPRLGRCPRVHELRARLSICSFCFHIVFGLRRMDSFLDSSATHLWTLKKQFWVTARWVAAVQEYLVFHKAKVILVWLAVPEGRWWWHRGQEHTALLCLATWKWEQKARTVVVLTDNGVGALAGDA